MYAQVEIKNFVSVLVFEDPTGMVQVKMWGKRSLEIDSIMYINDVKTTGGPVFPKKKFFNSSSALLLATKTVITYQGMLKVPEKRVLLLKKF